VPDRLRVADGAVMRVVEQQGEAPAEAPRDLLVAFGRSASEMLTEYRNHQDPLVKRIADSYATFRNRSQAYMLQSYAGNFAARGLVNWGQ